MNRSEDEAPYFESKTTNVILSSKVNRLTDAQEKSFYKLARRAVKLATREEDNDPADWKNIKDYSLYIEKSKEKHQYQFIYTVKTTKPIQVKVQYTIMIRLESKYLDGGKAQIKIMKFHLDSIE